MHLGAQVVGDTDLPFGGGIPDPQRAVRAHADQQRPALHLGRAEVRRPARMPFESGQFDSGRDRLPNHLGTHWPIVEGRAAGGLHPSNGTRPGAFRCDDEGARG